MKPRSGFLCLALVLSMAITRSFSQTISPVTVYDSFGPGNSYNTQLAAGIWGASYGYNGIAFPFTPDISGYLNTIELAVCQYRGSGCANFFVAQSNSQYPYPETILESYLDVYCPGTVGQNNPPLVLTSGSQPLLQAGTMYFVCAEPADDYSVVAWNANNQNLVGLVALEDSPWSWGWSTEPTSAFRVTLTPVPEPDNVMLSILGFGFLFWPFSRKGMRGIFWEKTKMDL